jgi:hypothetical protein
MIVVDTNITLEKRALSSEQTLPANPFPRKYIHSAFHDFQDAMQAFIALLSSGYDASDIHLMKGLDFVEAVEHRQTFLGFLCSSDDHTYLREAKRGKHMLSVRFSNYDQMFQVRDLLAPYNAYSMTYVDTWSITPLLI